MHLQAFEGSTLESLQSQNRSGAQNRLSFNGLITFSRTTRLLLRPQVMAFGVRTATAARHLHLVYIEGMSVFQTPTDHHDPAILGVDRRPLLPSSGHERALRAHCRILRDREEDSRPQPPNGGSFTSLCPTAQPLTRALQHSLFSSS